MKLQQQDQKQAANNNTKESIEGNGNKAKGIVINAIGQTQYPKTQMLWKKELKIISNYNNRK